ncbi:ATP-binding cassette domain-containing protein [Enteractinococcus fodinae]|uniref:D-methionine transport system ATP-binding protein n=1 Tax=Enteractinococcus fodinae TaxID=684663 RepID=A0ABU2B5H6_9MICC|nr:methionine ABC transporter ATP-binding protein [Enteractinococcus fodinae]MDR7347649.1 D-methionine transport system ATP-binding protein [Enteractinococcus fodinae]
MITLDSVSKRYSGKFGSIDALIDVSLEVEHADIFGIVGFSGAGKSTLIRMVNRLENPDSGTVTVDGQDVTSMRRKELLESRRNVGMVFQQFNLLETKTVFRNVAMPLILAGRSRAEIARRVDEVLEIVELSDKREARISQLSGGQKQRVGIARALATEPDILLCDEATSALDPKTTESILQLLKRINQTMGVTILLITHQMHVVQRICNKVAVMEGGRVVEQGTVTEVFGNPQSPTTQEFVQTVINDQIPEAIADLVREDDRNYRIYRLRYVGATRTNAFLPQLSRADGLEVNILAATVEQLENTVVGVFHLQLVGSDAAITHGEQLIDAAGVVKEPVQL